MKKYLMFIIPVILLIGLAIYYNIYYMGGSLSELKAKDVLEKIENKENFILCVTQTTCSHCAMFKPKLKSIANRYNLDIYYIEADQIKDKDKEKVNKYIFTEGTPTTIFFNKGEEKSAIYRITGDAPSSEVVKRFKKMGFIK